MCIPNPKSTPEWQSLFESRRLRRMFTLMQLKKLWSWGQFNQAPFKEAPLEADKKEAAADFTNRACGAGLIRDNQRLLGKTAPNPVCLCFAARRQPF
jgi:zona occludens toxin (predicted ATPase)